MFGAIFVDATIERAAELLASWAGAFEAYPNGLRTADLGVRVTMQDEPVEGFESFPTVVYVRRGPELEDLRRHTLEAFAIFRRARVRCAASLDLDDDLGAFDPRCPVECWRSANGRSFFVRMDDLDRFVAEGRVAERYTDLVAELRAEGAEQVTNDILRALGDGGAADLGPS